MEFLKVLIFAIAIGGALAGSAAERPYDFRKRLEVVHEPGRADGAVVAVPADADEVLVGAAKDFCDYLDVSMGVSARFARGRAAGSGGVTVAPDASLAPRAYRVETAKGGIRIAAADSRAAAQALYHLEDLMNLRRAPFVAYGSESRRSLFSPRTAFMPKTLATCIMPMPRISMKPAVDSDDDP